MCIFAKTGYMTDVGFKRLETSINTNYVGLISVRKGTDAEDIKEHIDGYFTVHSSLLPDEFLNREYSFDVKEARKINRWDENVNYNMVVVELKNVNGRNGSLFGRQNYFIFEFENCWGVVNRKKLAKYIKSKVDPKYVESGHFVEKVSGVEVSPYVVYKRPNSETYGQRDDRFAYVPVQDLYDEGLVGFEIKK